jgi:hypothetical protein
MPKIQVADVTYDFDPADLTNDEGIAVEKVMNCTFDQWNTKLAEGSMQAMTALVWLLQRRDNPALRYSDVHFKMGDVKAVTDDDGEAVDPAAVAELVPGGKLAEVPNSPEVDSTPVEEASTTVA